MQGMKYIERLHSGRLRQLLRMFPAVLLYGPRYCGKSTLAKHAFPGRDVFDLEKTADREAVSADVDGFLAAHPRSLVIDEAQVLPQLFPALRHAIDGGTAKGRFLILGSAGPRLVRTVSETLAGRAGLAELTPFLASELAGRGISSGRWFWGGFPSVLALRRDAERTEWLDSFVSTFLERDLPMLGYRLAPHRLRTLWGMLAHVHGGIVNVADLARSLGVSFHTVSAYLDMLESAFMIRRLPPYLANIGKRLVKSPKLYIRDTGLLHFFAGLRHPSELSAWPKRGASFEGMVVEELIAVAENRLAKPEFFYWRTAVGGETDLLVKDGRRIVPIEIKAGTSVGARDIAGLRGCMRDLSLRHGWVVYNGERPVSLGKGVDAVPWRMVVEGRTDPLA